MHVLFSVVLRVFPIHGLWNDLWRFCCTVCNPSHDDLYYPTSGYELDRNGTDSGRTEPEPDWRLVNRTIPSRRVVE